MGWLLWTPCAVNDTCPVLSTPYYAQLKRLSPQSQEDDRDPGDLKVQSATQAFRLRFGTLVLRLGSSDPHGRVNSIYKVGLDKLSKNGHLVKSRVMVKAKGNGEFYVLCGESYDKV